jgi:predicted nucleotidyltransferase
MEIIKDGRVRVRRGQITDFNDLPSSVTENFIRIKEFINQHFNKEIDVRVIGSHLEGYYDEFSDYDVVIDELPDNVVVNEEMNLEELESIVSDELGFDVNVIYHTYKYSPLIIP